MLNCGVKLSSSNLTLKWGQTILNKQASRVLLLVFAMIILVAFSACGGKSGNKYVYTLDDLYMRGLTEGNTILILSANEKETECSAFDLQSYLRIIDALTQGQPVSGVAPYALTDMRRRLAFIGESVQGYVAAEIDGKAYVQREDGIIYDLDDQEYRFMQDYCSVILPYPEDLDRGELLETVKDAVTRLLPTIQVPGYDDFQPVDVETVDDFYITDSPPKFHNDVVPASGQYTAIISCGDYYELQLGIIKAGKEWKATEMVVARKGVGLAYHPNEEWRVATFGPLLDDPGSWGVAQTIRVELYDYNTGEIFWKMDGVSPAGTTWSDDGRYCAISHEVGRAEKRGMRTELIDTTDMTSITLLPPDGEPSSRLQALEWISDTELKMYYGIIVYKNGMRDLESSRLIYNTVTGDFKPAH